MIREELIKKVALKMDEISSSDDVIVSVDLSDNNPLYTQINGLLNESINDVLTKAPIYRITSFVSLIPSNDIRVDNTEDGKRQIVVVKVPSDFIRIAAINDTLFKRPIVEVAIEGDETDKRQRNRFLMAKKSKPVAVIGRDEYGKRVITCYSYDLTDEPAPVASYVQRFAGELDLYSEIPADDYLADIISWTCAGRVFAAQGDQVKGQLCDTNAAALMI